MKTINIYKLICPINNIPFYIGQTEKPIEDRLKGHKTGNKWLKSNLGKRFRRLEKLGLLDNIKTELVTTCEEIDAKRVELEIIYEYRQMGYKLCNSIIINHPQGRKTVTDNVRLKHSISASKTNKGRKYTQATKDKISKSREKYKGELHSLFGKKVKPESIRKRVEKVQKKVKQYDLDFNYIQTFESLISAEKETGAKMQNISQVCKNKGNQISAKGFIWRFEGNEFPPLKRKIKYPTRKN